MAKKLFLLSTVLYVLLFFGLPGEVLGDASAQLKQAKRSVSALIKSGKDAEARAAIDNLIAEFSGDPNLPTTIRLFARKYKEAKKYEQAKSIFKKVATVFPGTDDALKAQIAIARMDVFGLMDSGNDAAAQAAIDKLIADFSGHPYLPTNLRYIAARYKQAEQYERAGDIYQQAAQHHPDSNGVTKAQLDASRMDILSFMEWGDDPNAQAAIEGLIADFNDYQRLPAVLRNFAEKYRKAKKYEEAESIYETIATDFPDTNDALRAQMAASMINILSFIDDGNDTAAMAAIDKLIADFNDQPRLPWTMFVLGEGYYKRAFSAENEKRDSESKEFFRKAIAIWEKIIYELPVDVPHTAHAYYFSARCCESVGEYGEAIQYYSEIIDNWPDYQYADYAHYLLARCFEKSVISGQISKQEASVEIYNACEKLLAEYPDSQLIKAALGLLEYWDAIMRGEITL